MAKKYDVVILGGGVAGYVTALRGAQLGFSIAVVEQDKLGGTCLHRGCIPTKALLRSAEVFHTAQESKRYGVLVGNISLDFAQMQKRKEEIVKRLYKGILHLFKQREIDIYKGRGRVMGPSIFSPLSGTIAIDTDDGETEMLISDTAVILATGSSPRSLPSISPDGKRVLNTDQILSISELPSSIGIIGGGVIGIEWASLLSDLGVAVTIFEVAPAILIHEDSDVQQEVAKQLTRRGITIKTETSVTKVEPEEHMVRVSYKPLAQDSEETLEFSHVLVCVGRKANIEGIGLEATEIAVKDGFVQVDEGFRTKEKHIYAIGDMIGGPMLAHVAAWQGMFVMQQLAGKKTLKDPAIPRCIYSRPEVASIGMNEQEAKERGFAVKVGMFPLRANGKALIHGDNQGFIKIIVDHKSDDLLGAHLVGYQATDLISLFSVGSVVDVSGWELSQAIYPHPTVAEAIGEAALDLGDGPIHA